MSNGMKDKKTDSDNNGIPDYLEEEEEEQF